MRQVALQEEEVQFAALVREAEAGGSVTVMREGKPVAQIVPFPNDGSLPRPTEDERLEAVRELKELMANAKDLGIVWNGRDELYDRD